MGVEHILEKDAATAEDRAFNGDIRTLSRPIDLADLTEIQFFALDKKGLRGLDNILWAGRCLVHAASVRR